MKTEFSLTFIHLAPSILSILPGLVFCNILLLHFFCSAFKFLTFFLEGQLHLTSFNCPIIYAYALTFFIYQILPISLIFLPVICVPCPRSYLSLCHVNLYVLLLLLHMHFSVNRCFLSTPTPCSNTTHSCQNIYFILSRVNNENVLHNTHLPVSLYPCEDSQIN